MNPSEEYKRQFDNDGYSVIKGAFTPSDFDPIYQYMYNLFSIRCPELKQFAAEERPWFRQEFHDSLLNLRKTNRAGFSHVYDCCQHNIAKYHFLSSPKIRDAVRGLFSPSEGEFAISGLMLRMDPPSDSRNSLDWHQDQPYYPESSRADAGMVIWIPMQDVSQVNGSIFVCPGSHKEGVAKVREYNTEDGGSEQKRISDEALSKYPHKAVVASMGDIVAFSMLLFHRSGDNSSGRFRFTLGARYHMVDNDYLPPADLKIIFNKKVTQNAETY